MLKIYEYNACSTCKKALKFLDSHGIKYQKISIVDQPPSKAELKKMAGFIDGGVRKLFNVSGVVYRDLKLKDRLNEMSEPEMFDLLAAHGKLVKRPFLLGKSFGTVGFKDAVWSALF